MIAICRRTMQRWSWMESHRAGVIGPGAAARLQRKAASARSTSIRGLFKAFGDLPRLRRRTRRSDRRLHDHGRFHIHHAIPAASAAGARGAIERVMATTRWCGDLRRTRSGSRKGSGLGLRILGDDHPITPILSAMKKRPQPSARASQRGVYIGAICFRSCRAARHRLAGAAVGGA